MSKQTKPRASDVARWVATIAAAPAPTEPGASMPCYRKRDAAIVRLAAAGLDAQGNPKPAPVVDNRAEQEWGARGVFQCGGAK